ncbi:MAG: decaprenyl-phosphate phosphoribosyltransferase [Oscillospiraceae bacterium]|nr:decaprenyl-phosphate phosphoribosyltransferase [Oscillospiraceae bacterium]
MRKYFKLLRVHHYMKNMLVIAALACSGQIFESAKLFSCLIGLIAFCALSSAVYIFNDIRDIDKDRLHETKKDRPLASGAVDVKTAKIIGAALVCAAFVLNALVFKVLSTVWLVIYLVLNILYSMGLKDIPLVDISILVAGFVIRVLYGATIAEVSVSKWLYLTVVAFSFMLALGKRRNEILRGGTETRSVLKHYSESFLDKSMYMCLGLTNTFYALWSMDSQTASHYHNDFLVFTVPIIMLITLKYMMDIESDSDGDPVEVLLHDKLLLVLCTTYLFAMFCILYLA